MVSVTVDVDLDEFTNEEILECAAEILENRENRQSKTLSSVLKRIQNAVAVEDDSLPPISTAARIKSMEELRSVAKGFAA